MFVYPGVSTAAAGPSMEKNSLIAEEEGEGKPHSMFQQAGYHRGISGRCVSIGVELNFGMCPVSCFICQET